MFRFPEVPQEHALMLKRGGKVKHKTKQTRKTKGKQAVNIKNIITINRGGGGRGKPSQPAQPAQTRPQYQGIGTLLPFLSMLRPQSNDTRSVSVTSATAGEANNNVMDTIRKTQEITESKLNALIDDMGANNNVMDTIRKTQEITESKLNARIDDMGGKLTKDFREIARMTFLAMEEPKLPAKAPKKPKKPQDPPTDPFSMD
jgi:hypothetical protein